MASKKPRAKKGKLLWAGRSTCVVVDELSQHKHMKMVVASNSDGETFAVVLDGLGRNVGHGYDEAEAFDSALAGGHLLNNDAELVKAWRKRKDINDEQER